MNSEGCTIKILCFSYSYKWTELKTKRYEYCEKAVAYKDPFMSGAIFCKFNTKKPNWMMPSMYSAFIRPFSFFFVYFALDVPKVTPDIYVVNEEEFRSKMEEWGVDIVDIKK